MLIWIKPELIPMSMELVWTRQCKSTNPFRQSLWTKFCSAQSDQVQPLYLSV